MNPAILFVWIACLSVSAVVVGMCWLLLVLMWRAVMSGKPARVPEKQKEEA